MLYKASSYFLFFVGFLFVIFFAEKKAASRFFRTLSSQGKRPDPASKAALHSTRVKSAVMTPSRKQRMEKEAQGIHQKMSKLVAKAIVLLSSTFALFKLQVIFYFTINF